MSQTYFFKTTYGSHPLSKDLKRFVVLYMFNYLKQLQGTHL